MTAPAHARALIAYEPPDGGQTVRPRAPRDALAAVRRFLEACTSPAVPPSDVRLSVAERTADSPPDYAPEPVLADAIARFGFGRRRELGRRWPDGALLGHRHEWDLPHARLDAVADVLVPLPAWPSGVASPVVASVAWPVLLADPGTRTVLPEQGHGSRVALFLSSRSHAAFDLRFPFERPNEAFLDYVAAIRPFLPIKVAWSRFRLRRPTGAGMGYTARRISPGLFDGL